MATVRREVAIGPSENLAATRSFRAARRIAEESAGIASAILGSRASRIAARAKISAIADRGEFKAVAEARGLDRDRPDAIRVRLARAREISTGRRFDRPREGRERSSEVRSSASRTVASDRRVRAPEGRYRLAGASAQRARGRPVADRPRRDNEDDSKIFAKRPAFGGRGAYRERKPDFEKRAPRAADA